MKQWVTTVIVEVEPSSEMVTIFTLLESSHTEKMAIGAQHMLTPEPVESLQGHGLKPILHLWMKEFQLSPAKPMKSRKNTTTETNIMARASLGTEMKPTENTTTMQNSPPK